MAKVVDSGLGQGFKCFYAMVFSLFDFVLIQVRVGKDGCVHIDRSPLMNLFYFDDANSRSAVGPRSRNLQSDRQSIVADDLDIKSEQQGPGEESDESTIRPDTPSSEKDSEDLTQFMVLMCFFDAAAYGSMTSATSKVFPNEILTAIMEFADPETYLALSKVSACCRKLSSRECPVNDEYKIVGIDLDDECELLLEDSAGRKTRAGLGYQGRSWISPRDKPTELKLHPVIGIADVSRQSIMDMVTLRLPGIPPQEPVFTKKLDLPVQ